MRIDAEALALETWARVRRVQGTEISVDKIIKEIEATIKEVIRIQNAHVVKLITEKNEQHISEVIEALYSS